MPLFPVSRKKQSAFDCFFDLLVRCLIKTQELDIHADCVQNAGFVKLMTLLFYAGFHIITSPRDPLGTQDFFF